MLMRFYASFRRFALNVEFKISKSRCQVRENHFPISMGCGDHKFSKTYHEVQIQEYPRPLVIRWDLEGVGGNGIAMRVFYQFVASPRVPILLILADISVASQGQF